MLHGLGCLWLELQVTTSKRRRLGLNHAGDVRSAGRFRAAAVALGQPVHGKVFDHVGSAVKRTKVTAGVFWQPRQAAAAL